MGGMCSYYHDLIYLAAIVQVASIFTDRIWWSFLLVQNQSFVQSNVAHVMCGLKRDVVCRGFDRKGWPYVIAMQVPAFAVYQLWVSVLQPFVFAPRQKVGHP